MIDVYKVRDIINQTIDMISELVYPVEDWIRNLTFPPFELAFI